MRGGRDGLDPSQLERQVADLLRPPGDRKGAVGSSGATIRAIPADAIPEPDRALLAHDEGMTATLEAYWSQPIRLRPLSVRRDGDVLLRQIVLVAAEHGRPVGFGAVRIHLDRFEVAARAEIVAGEAPLGTILRTHHVGHERRIRGFFRLASEALTHAGFDARAHPVLYGRHSVLLSPAGEVMAEVVEVLPRSDAGAPRAGRAR